MDLLDWERLTCWRDYFGCQLKRNQPTANVMLLTSEAFANYFTQALRDRSLPGFRQRFRGVDVPLVDDVEFFESKRVFPREEFLHTFTELVDHGRQVVLDRDRGTHGLLTKLGDELATRFLSGLVCRLNIPDAATRQSIVRSQSGSNDWRLCTRARAGSTFLSDFKAACGNWKGRSTACRRTTR